MLRHSASVPGGRSTEAMAAFSFFFFFFVFPFCCWQTGNLTPRPRLPHNSIRNTQTISYISSCPRRAGGLSDVVAE